MVRKEMSRVSAKKPVLKKTSKILSLRKTPARSQLGLVWMQVRKHVC